MGYTEFPVRIETELDLIRQIREKGEIQSGGEYYTKTTKDKIGKFNKLLIFSFWFYNRGSNRDSVSGQDQEETLVSDKIYF